MNADDEDRMQIEEKGYHEAEVDVVRWDGDLEPSPVIDIEINNSSSSATLTQSNNQASQFATHPDYLAKAHEETTKKALLLRRNELKWKLMQASQSQNRAKLNEIKQEMIYHREKLSKTQDLAARLRDRYVKIIKSAKLSESQLKKAEIQFQSHEKFVAVEKMELTKIALNCLNIGRTLYGESYKLPNNPPSNGGSASTTFKPRNGSNGNLVQSAGSTKALSHKMKCRSEAIAADCSNTNDQTEDESNRGMSSKIAPFIRRARTQANISSIDLQNIPNASTSTATIPSTTSKEQPATFISDVNSTLSAETTGRAPNEDLRATIIKKRERVNSRLSALYDFKESVLKNIVTYRLTTRFASAEQHKHHPLTDLTYSHNNSPNEYVCLPDLISKCSDKNCAYKHQSSYMISDTEKLREILASKPSTTFNFLLSLQMDHKRLLPASLTTLDNEQPSIHYTYPVVAFNESSQRSAAVIKREVADNPMLD